jgi:putative hemolysin
MPVQVALEIVIVVVLVLVNGVLAMSELAIVSSRRYRLQQRADDGDRGAAVALELADEPNRFLSTVQIGITLVGIFAGAFGGATLAEEVSVWLEDAGMGEGSAEVLAVVLVVLVITYLSLVIGEIVPKRVALQNPEGIASRAARPMRVLSRVAAPVVAVLSVSTDAVLTVLRVGRPEDTAISEEEIRLLLQQSREAGVIDVHEQAMASAVLRLGDRNAGDVMTPRPEVRWLERDSEPGEIREVVVTQPHSRYPVCDGDLDRVIGTVALKDLVGTLADGREPQVAPLLRTALFVPETLGALHVLERIRQAREPLAIVVDEHGGTAGIVTLADVFAAVVGDFVTADETAELPIVRRPDGSLLVDGALPTDELKAELEVDDLPEEGEYSTFAGFVIAQLGRIPAPGDRFEWDRWAFEVMDMDGRRVDKVLVTPQHPLRRVEED